MRPWNETPSLVFLEAVQAYKLEEVRREIEQIQLEREALKARQGHPSIASQGMNWLRQQFSAFVDAIKKQHRQPNPPVFTRR